MVTAGGFGVTLCSSFPEALGSFKKGGLIRTPWRSHRSESTGYQIRRESSRTIDNISTSKALRYILMKTELEILR